MVAGISGVSDRIKQMNVEVAKEKAPVQDVVKHMPQEDKPKEPERPDGVGNNFSVSV